MKKSLAEFNLFYSLCLPLVEYGTWCHYRRVVVRGKDNLPEEIPYILAPTHQNAMMDPLVVLMALNRPVAFMARADIFRKPVARFFLTWLRISPVYRIRDGRDQLSRNEEVFGVARRSLEQGIPLCLMAEGTHNDRHQLLPLVKGMFRIAGQTQRELAGQPLYIVPVGLDYDHYETPYHSVVVNFGKPIPVQQYMAEFDENEPLALNHMRADLTVAMKGVMHQVNSDDHYDDEYAYCHLRTPQVLHEQGWRNSVWGRFMARRKVSQQLADLPPNELETIYQQGAEFRQACDQSRVPLWFASKCPRQAAAKWTLRWLGSSLGVLLCIVLCWDMLPLWVLSNPVVYLPTHFIPRATVKDPQFRSSINFAIRFGLSLVYMLLFFVVNVCLFNLWRALVLLVVGLLSAWLTPKVFVLVRDMVYGYRWFVKGRKPNT